MGKSAYSCSVLPLRLPSCEVNEWVGLWSCCSYDGPGQSHETQDHHCAHARCDDNLACPAHLWWEVRAQGERRDFSG
ncbi:unnamed protein product [Gadus morhua 'NCC']